MAVDMFLELDGIKGESVDAVHKDKIDVLAWSWGISNTGTFHQSTGGGAGRANFKAFTIKKNVDRSTCDLLHQVASGKRMPKAKLIVRKAGDKPLEYLIFTFSGLAACRVQMETRNEVSTEVVGFNFEQVETEYKIQDSRGLGKAGGMFSWNPVSFDNSVPASWPYQTRAAWMEFALKEAKRWAGTDEDVITTYRNYHQETGANFFKTMSGTANAWCASFVNWCLQRAGYNAWKVPFRASAIENDSRFVKIDTPVYGAIALVGSHHAAFVFAQDKGSKRVICLGGNQSDQIDFAVFNERTTFYVPALYWAVAKEEIAHGVQLKRHTAVELNETFGTYLPSKTGNATR